MPAKAETNGPKPKRETWLDWMPDGVPAPTDLLTRDDLIELLHRIRVDVNANELRYWEYAGVLPRPVRRWHEGAVRALYPEWITFLVKELRRLQRRENLTLEEIGPRLRTHARIMLAYGDAPEDEEIRRNNPRAQTPEDIHLWPDLVSDLERLARWWARLAGDVVDRVEVHVVGSTGRATRYPLPIAATDDADPLRET